MGANYLFINASRSKRCEREPHNFTQSLHMYTPDGTNTTSNSQATFWVWISNRLRIRLRTTQAWEAPAQRVRRSAAIFLLDLPSAIGCDLWRLRHRCRLWLRCVTSPCCATCAACAPVPPLPPGLPVPLSRLCRLRPPIHPCLLCPSVAGIHK